MVTHAERLDSQDGNMSLQILPYTYINLRLTFRIFNAMPMPLVKFNWIVTKITK